MTNNKDFKEQLLQNPEVKAEYDALEPEFHIAYKSACKKEYEEEYAEEYAEAYKKGIEEGRLLTLVELVREGVISMEEAVKRSNMTAQEFQDAILSLVLRFAEEEVRKL